MEMMKEGDLFLLDGWLKNSLHSTTWKIWIKWLFTTIIFSPQFSVIPNFTATSLSLSFSFSLSLSLSLSLFLSISLSLSLSLSLSFSHFFSLSISLSLSPYLSLFIFLFLSLSLSLSLFYLFSLSFITLRFWSLIISFPHFSPPLSPFFPVNSRLRH